MKIILATTAALLINTAASVKDARSDIDPVLMQCKTAVRDKGLCCLMINKNIVIGEKKAGKCKVYIAPKTFRI